MSGKDKLSAIEKIKVNSDGLRGTIKESLADEITGAIREDDQAVIKFHGMRMQGKREALPGPGRSCLRRGRISS